MVRIPTPVTQGAQQLGAVQPVAAQTPFQQLRMPDLSFNARQLAGLGTALGNVAAEFAERGKRATLLEAQQDINDWRNGVFNPDTGILRQEGGNAVGVTDRTITSAEEFTTLMEQRYGDRLTESGRYALRTMLQETAQSTTTRAIAHETTQRRAYEVSLLESNIEDALDQIQRNPTDDAVFNQQVSRILTTTAQASSLAGETGDTVGTPAGNREQEALTAAVGARVATLAGPKFRQPTEALALLDSFAGQIDPDTYAELYPQIREASINQRALSEAEAARVTEMTGLAPTFVPQAANASSAGARVIDYNGMPLAISGDANPLVGAMDGASRMTNPDAAVTMDEMLRGPFMVLQRRLGRTLVIRDAIAKAGTSRESETPGSQHFQGAALDVDITNMSYQERLMLVREAMQLGFRGFGFGNGTIHIDMRQQDGPTVWTYGGHESGWNGLSEAQLRTLVGGMQGGTWTPDAAATTGGDYIMSIADPEVRARAQQAFTADLAFQNSMESRQRAQILSDIYARVETDFQSQQAGDGVMGDISDYLTPDDIKTLGQDAVAVRRYIDQVRSGAERVTDQTVYNEIYTKLTSPYPEIRSAAANDPGVLFAAQPDLSVSDFKALLTLQQSLRAEAAGGAAESAEARAVNTLMAEVTQARINNVLPDIVSGYSGIESRVRDSAERSALSDRLQAEATRMIRPQLRSYLASLSDAERDAIAKDKTLLDQEIGNIARQLMQDVDISGLPKFDDASFLEVIATIDDQEGFTLDQLLSARGDAAITVPIQGLATPIVLDTEYLSKIATDLTSRSGGIAPTPSAVIEQAYTLLRGEMMTPVGRARLAELYGVQQDVTAQLTGGNAPAAPEAAAAPAPQPGLLGPLYTPPETLPESTPEVNAETTFSAEPMRMMDLERSFMGWFKTRDTAADAAALTPAMAMNYLQYMRQQLPLLGGASINLSESQSRAILQAVPLQSTLDAQERRLILQGLSGVEGPTGQSRAFDELFRLLNASRLP